MPKSRGRRNPKKDKSARRRRPDRSPGRVTERPTGQVRMRLESVVAAILQAPAELAPVVGCAGVWMYNAAENHVQGNHCVDACLCISHASRVSGLCGGVELGEQGVWE